MKKTTKKINAKQLAKNEVKAKIADIFTSDFEIIDCCETPIEGFTKDTLIIRGFKVENNEPIDIQVKLIAPKFGINQYDIEDDE